MYTLICCAIIHIYVFPRVNGDSDNPLMLDLVVDEMEQQVQELADNQRKIQATQSTILES